MLVSHPVHAPPCIEYQQYVYVSCNMAPMCMSLRKLRNKNAHKHFIVSLCVLFTRDYLMLWRHFGDLSPNPIQPHHNFFTWIPFSMLGLGLWNIYELWCACSLYEWISSIFFQNAMIEICFLNRLDQVLDGSTQPMLLIYNKPIWDHYSLDNVSCQCWNWWMKSQPFDEI